MTRMNLHMNEILLPKIKISFCKYHGWIFDIMKFEPGYQNSLSNIMGMKYPLKKNFS